MTTKSINFLALTLILLKPLATGASKDDFRQFNGDPSEEADLQYRPDQPSQLQVAWGALTRPWTRNAILNELTRSKDIGINVSSLPFSRLDGKTNDQRNPFWIHAGDFFTGLNRVVAPLGLGPAPEVPSSDTSWFNDQVQKNASPDIFVIGGHHVISEGFHNDPETMFMYTPTLLDTLERVPAARTYFDRVKLAFLWGCNTLTDLEPHAGNGDYLSPAQIEELYMGNSSTRAKVVGSTWATNTLEFYRARLAREYGPGAHHYEYTRDPKKEVCISSPGNPYLNCKVTNVDRILPDRLLYDGSHAYNGAAIHKKIFRNAYLVLGFNSASPSEEVRVKIFQAAIADAYQKLNAGLSPTNPAFVSNLLREISADETPKDRRIKLIQVLRKSWTVASFKLNRERPSGSITPALPELDRDGMFPVAVSKDAPLHAPYESRN